MNNGVVQQIDTPLALYNEPANLFVGGFLGTPAMNIIHGTLKQERDALVFHESGEGTIEARFDAAERPALAAFSGKPVVLAIRPEAIRITERPKGKEQVAGSFPALVDVVEALGAETNLHLDTGAHAVVCRGDATLVPADAGRRMYFQMDLAKAHLFDPATTLRIV
jgi:multiple sugar transport system ATP-binding protein